MLHSNEYLQLIQDTLQYLKEHPDSTLAAASDYHYFREQYKTSVARRRGILAPPAAVIAPLSIPEAKIETVQPEVVLPKKEIEPPKITPPSSPKTAPVETKVMTPAADSLQWPTYSFSKWKAIFSKIAPDLPVLSEMPQDWVAKKIATRWKTKNLSAPITILSYQELPEQKTLLEQITLALDVHFGPAKLVSAEPLEKEGQWDTFLSVEELKVIITCDYTLWQMPGLLKYYKENAGGRHIGEKELFLLPDLSLYLKDPLLKRSLWKALCQTCQPLSPPSSSTKT